MRGSAKLKSMRIIHSVGTFLNISENWIYPQIVDVPDATGLVLCRTTLNKEMFPLQERALLTERPKASSKGVRWMVDGVLRRFGKDKASMSMILRSWRPQLLHAHFGRIGWDRLTLAAELGIPLVTSFYGIDAWKLPEAEPEWRERYTALFREGKVFLVEGPAMRERLIVLGCPEEKVLVQRLGVDLTDLAFQPKDFSGGLKIALVGRFVEKKGLQDGLRACRLAAKNGVDLKVTVIGDGDASIAEDLRMIASTPELEGKVSFAGFRPLDETRSILKEHNVFLCPSKHAADGDAEGGSPVTLTESMALGLLCIGTTHCDIPQVIREGMTGYLCPEGDVEKLAHLLAGVTDNPDAQLEVTRRGREHVESAFSLNTQLAGLREIYGRIVGD